MKTITLRLPDAEAAKLHIVNKNSKRTLSIDELIA